jgi:nitroreductase
MDALEAIFTRRSVRDFSPAAVPDELLRQVLAAAAASASGGNVQPWGFVLVRSTGRLAGLRSLAPGIIGRPAAVVALCLDHERSARLGGTDGEQIDWINIGLATQNLLLAAHSLGLGACPIGSFHVQAVTAYLGLPAGVEPVLLVALGFPVSPPAPPGRRPLGEVCFEEEWGTSYG